MAPWSIVAKSSSAAEVTNLVLAPRWAAADSTAETASSRSGLPKATMRTSLAAMPAA